MNKLLIRFFQVLFLIPFLGYGQLNTHPDQDGLPAAHLTLLNKTTQLAAGTDGFIFDATLGIPQARKLVRFIVPDVDEEEYESVSSKHFPGNAHSFSTLFDAPLPDYLHHNSKSSLAFCKRISFIPVSNRNLVFGVFRI